MAFDGKTRLAALIGRPVGHSMSPAIHNAAFAALGLNWAYVAFDVAPENLTQALGSVRVLGIGGLSVTMPHKAGVASLVDDPSPSVQALGACNTVVVLPDGRLRGENTDGDGLVDSLEAGNQPVAGRRVVIFGAGGSGRSVAEAFGRRGAADVAIVNRTPTPAVTAAGLAGSVGRVGTVGDVSAADIIVNSTSLGMGDSGSVPFDVSLLQPHHVVVDAVYQPLVTPLLAAAATTGCRTFDGLGMLVYQAARQFTLWTGHDAPIDVMLAAVRRSLG